MAQIVINIPDEVFEDAKNNRNFMPLYRFQMIWNAIADGTLLQPNRDYKSSYDCKYCWREIDNSGLEGFRCSNPDARKRMGTSWCRPMNAGMPCSSCEYCNK